MKEPIYMRIPLDELRDWQETLLKNLASSRPNSFEWTFNTNQLDEVNRALAARR